MKHDLPVTLVLVGLFVVSQLVGLGTISAHLQPEVNKTTGTIDISYPPTAIGEAPAVKNKSASFVYIVIGVLIGTLILLLFMRFKFNTAWTYWFLLSVILTLAVAWGVFIPRMVAIPLAIIFAISRISMMLLPSRFCSSITRSVALSMSAREFASARPYVPRFMK